MAVFFLALLLGLRHGIDWDHIAAITDVTGTSTHKKEAFWLALLYVVGHALVVVLLGIAAIAIGVNLPEWVDPLMEKFVGITLIFLGAWLLITIWKQGKNFKLKSRWMLILESLNRLSLFFHNKIPHRHEHQEMRESGGKNIWKTAFSVGMIHGVGAETPSQVLLFITAAGVGHGTTGILLLLTFVLGLIVSNTAISVLSILGYAQAKNNSKIYLILGLVTAGFSLFLGFVYLFNLGIMSPPLL